MLRAIGLWKRFPATIRADLQLYYGRHIREWLRPCFAMSSGELIDLLYGMPETSKYKGALRGYPFGIDYEWCQEEYRSAALVRQLAPLDESGDMPLTRPLYTAYFSPLERQAIEAQRNAAQVQKAIGRAHILSGLYAWKGRVSDAGLS